MVEVANEYSRKKNKEEILHVIEREKIAKDFENNPLPIQGKMSVKKYSGYGYHSGGRKPKGDEPKTTTMSIVCTASEKEKIKELAKNSGLSISAYIVSKLFN